MADQLRKRIRLIHICGSAGVVVILAGATLLGVLPMLQSGRESIQKAQGLADELKQLETVRVKAEELQKKIAQRQAQIEKEEGRLPTRAQQGKIIEEITAVAATAGVKLEGIDKQEIQPAGNYKILPAQVTVTGSYQQCYAFLAGLRHMERLTRLENASVITEAGDSAKPGQRGDCQLRVAIATYMAK
jgi:Tfp pilus assembly protein PilO